jgi:sarcosine oxidase
MLLNTSVGDIQEEAGVVNLRLDNDEVVVAVKVIVATGPWIKQMLTPVLGNIMKTYLQTQYWFDIDSTQYNDLLPGKMPVFLCGDDITPTTRSFYNFPAIAGPTGGMKFAVHESDLEVKPGDKNDTQPVTSGQEVYNFASNYIKHIKPKVLKSLNCLYTMTPDENFILDFLPGSSRVVIASACSGHGFKYSSATGEAAARLAIGEVPIMDTSNFSLQRFQS